MAAGVIAMPKFTEGAQEPTTAEDIIKAIENLPEAEKRKVFAFFADKLTLGQTFAFWDNEEDDVYNDL